MTPFDVLLLFCLPERSALVEDKSEALETNYREGNRPGKKINQISSKKHRLIKDIRRLERRSYRDRDRLFVIEGVNSLSEAIYSGYELKTALFIPERKEEVLSILDVSSTCPELFEVTHDLMDWISDVVKSQGVLGVLSHIDLPLEKALEESLSMLIIADRVSDPGNLGALIRVADAAGADCFIAGEGSCDIYNRKVVRSSAGSLFHLPICRNVDLSISLDVIKSKGFAIFGLDPRGSKNYLDADMTMPFAVIVGNEASGILSRHRQAVDELLFIEMPGKAESLNVACSVSIVVFEALRQRRGVLVRNNEGN